MDDMDIVKRDAAAGVISDEQLDEWAANTIHRGNHAAEPHLRPLTPEQRAQAVSEARIRMNTSPGWLFSHAVWQGAQDVAAGRRPMHELNQKLMAHDPDGTKAARAAATGQGWDGFKADALASEREQGR